MNGIERWRWRLREESKVVTERMSHTHCGDCCRYSTACNRLAATMGRRRTLPLDLLAVALAKKTEVADLNLHVHGEETQPGEIVIPAT